MGLAARNRHRKRAALSERALYPHATTVQSDEFLNECQSDPCAFVRPGVDTLDAMKALEHTLALVVGDAHACVTDLQFHCAFHGLQRNRNLALERELEGVGEQIQNDLFPHVTIYVHRFCDWLALD